MTKYTLPEPRTFKVFDFTFDYYTEAQLRSVVERVRREAQIEAYAQGQRDMREQAAKRIESPLTNYATVIRALPIGEV